MCVYTYPFVFAYMVGRSVDEVGGWTGPKPLHKCPESGRFQESLLAGKHVTMGGGHPLYI